MLGFKRSMRTLAKSQDNGRWNCTDVCTVIVTAGMGIVYTIEGRTDDVLTLAIIAELCPRGRGDFVSEGLLDLLDPERNPTEESEYIATS